MNGLDKFVADIRVDPFTEVGDSTLNENMLCECVLPARVLCRSILLVCENNERIPDEDPLSIRALADPIPDNDIPEATLFDDHVPNET